MAIDDGFLATCVNLEGRFPVSKCSLSSEGTVSSDSNRLDLLEVLQVED